MKLVKTFNVPAEFFYQKMIHSILFDIRKSTGETIKEHRLKGFSYVKQFSSNAKGKITIDEIVSNETYAYTTSTVRNEFKVSYQIRAISASECEVTYSEEVVSYGFLQKANDLLFGIFLVPFKKKQLIKMLSAIEASY